MDVISRDLFACLTANQDARALARVIINIMTKHAYLPIKIISDRGSAFVYQVIREVADVLGVTLEHVTIKNAETIGMFKRTNASLRKALKIETEDQKPTWHKYANIAVLNHSTSYHTSMGCEPS